MTSLDSVVGELNIVNGRRQSTTPHSGAFTAPRRSARGRLDDTFFLLIDAPGAHPAVPDLIQRIQNAYWHVPGSVTSGLRAALDAGNNWLVDHNQSAVAPLRGGVTGAVLRGSEVFIAQVGPACAFVGHQGRLERFPMRDVSGGSQPPLGVARVLEVRFSHAELHPGDVLLLCDAAFATRVPDEAIASAVVYVGVEPALNNLERLAGGESLAAMVIEAAAAAAAAGETRAGASPAAASAQGPVAAAPPEDAPRPERKVGVWAGALKDSVARSAGSLGSVTRALVQRTLPDRPTSAQTRRRAGHGPSALERNTPLMIGLAVGIPILVAILVSTIYLERSTAAQVDALLTEARQFLQQADGVSSVETKHELWSAALNKASEALRLSPDDARALEVRAQAQAQLDRLDRTVRVSPVQLYDFKKVGRHRLAMQGVSLFVLDQAESRVERFALEGDSIAGGAPAPVAAKGISVDSRTVSDMLDMIWAPAGGERQKSAVIILERGGLVEFDLAFGLAAIPFADSTVPVGARRLDTFDGNLYLLDTVGRQVWRYRPSGDGYSGLPDPYFENPLPELENAIDMAIDGRVYIIEANGVIHKYFGGSSAPFNLDGLSTPLGRPAALALDPTAPNESSLYVADYDNARIVHLSPDGRFIRQLRSPGDEFAALEDLLVDERAGKVYVISGGRLYVASLPAAATP